MANIEKKRTKLMERIKELEGNVVKALTQKTSDSKEINVGKCQRDIADLRMQLSKLK